jgi:hypothetical protein
MQRDASNARRTRFKHRKPRVSIVLRIFTEYCKGIANRWANWCGDREMEQAIRRHLTREGYFGTTAKLKNVRLVAIQRPGWLQVYRFDATARVAVVPSDDQPDPPPQDRSLFGLVREDARRGTEIRTFSEPEGRGALFIQWSEGLIRLRGSAGLKQEPFQ